jgi:uncharacterized protein YraI
MSAAALAEQAYTTRTANLRAGPAPDFPVVARLAPGTPVFVDGCLSDYAWCDVEVGGMRGWLNTRTLQAYYGSRVVPLYGYGATIGLPIITFSLGNYWDRYYRGRTWYSERPRWERHWHAYAPRHGYAYDYNSYGRAYDYNNNYGRTYDHNNNYGRGYDNRGRVVEAPRVQQYRYTQPSPRTDYQQAQPRFAPQTTPQGGIIEQRGNRYIERQPNGRIIDRTPNDTEHQGQ